MAQAGLSRVGEIVRQHDPDRFFTVLFAPAEHRETLFTLYAFNHELARASEVTREPIAALIRLQWWREVVEGARRRHEVAGPVGEALDSGRLLASDLAGLVDAREAEVEPIPDLAAFDAYLMESAGGLMVAAGRVLGMLTPDTLRRPGAAYGMTGVFRNTAILARQGRFLLPKDTLSKAGLTSSTMVSERNRTELAKVRVDFAKRALNWLMTIPNLQRSEVAAALPIRFARARLRLQCNTKLIETQPHWTSERLSVLVAFITLKP